MEWRVDGFASSSTTYMNKQPTRVRTKILFYFPSPHDPSFLSSSLFRVLTPFIIFSSRLIVSLPVTGTFENPGTPQIFELTFVYLNLPFDDLCFCTLSTTRETVELLVISDTGKSTVSFWHFVNTRLLSLYKTHVGTFTFHLPLWAITASLWADPTEADMEFRGRHSYSSALEKVLLRNLDDTSRFWYLLVCQIWWCWTISAEVVSCLIDLVKMSQNVNLL